MPNPFSQKAGKTSAPSRPTSTGEPKPGQRSQKQIRLKTSTGTSTGVEKNSGNPWSSRLGKTDSSMSSLQTTSKKTTRRGISRVKRSGSTASPSTSQERKQTGSYTVIPLPTGPDVSGVSVGDRVRITWEVDPAYRTPDSGSFEGVVTALDDWITAKNAGVKFHYPVYTLGSVERIEHRKPKRIKPRVRV
jgi:hypothetical protein